MNLNVICVFLQLVGAALLVLGCWYLIDTRTVKFNDVSREAGLTSVFHSAAIIICVIGVVIILVAILGCIGACQESSVCLIVVCEPQTIIHF